MTPEQRDSIIRSILKIAGAILIMHGFTKYAGLVNSPDVIGLIVMLMGLWQSHTFHAESAAKPLAELKQIMEQFCAGPAAPDHALSQPAAPPSLTGTGAFSYVPPPSPEPPPAPSSVIRPPPSVPTSTL